MKSILPSGSSAEPGTVGFLFPPLAVPADPGDEQAMTVHFEVVLPGNCVSDPFDLVAVKLDQLVAHFAVQMVVPRIAVLVLIDATSAESHLANQPGLRQFTQRSIDRWPADLAFGDEVLQMIHQLVGVEVVVMAENLLDDNPTLLRDSLAARLEKLHEPILRWLWRLDGTERVVARHDWRPAGGACVGVTRLDRNV